MAKQSSEEFSGAGETCWPSEMEKFAETEVRSQRENFLTSLFAWVLDANPPIREAVLGHLFHQLEARRQGGRSSREPLFAVAPGT